MPIYEYRCSSCGHELEALQKFSEAPLTACPSCANATLVKLVSAAGFHLKGSGWYATDFKGGGSKPAPVKDSGESKSDAKPDAKPDAKSDAKPEPTGESKSQVKTGATSGNAAPATGSGATPAST